MTARAFLSTTEAADLTGLSPEWFFVARKKGEGPPYLRVTSRIVKYDRDDLLGWFRQFRVQQ